MKQELELWDYPEFWDDGCGSTMTEEQRLKAERDATEILLEVTRRRHSKEKQKLIDYAGGSPVSEEDYKLSEEDQRWEDDIIDELERKGKRFRIISSPEYIEIIEKEEE